MIALTQGGRWMYVPGTCSCCCSGELRVCLVQRSQSVSQSVGRSVGWSVGRGWVVGMPKTCFVPGTFFKLLASMRMRERA